MIPPNENGLPQIESYEAARRRRRRWLPGLVIGLSILILVLAVATPLWLPGALRTLIPDRYLAAYAPEPVQELIFDRNPVRLLPTAHPLEPGVANTLLGGIEAEETATPTPEGVGVVEPSQATPTPASGAEPGADGPAFVPAQPSIDTGPLPPSAQLTGFEQTYQGWNNCGPATLTMYLNYYGLGVSQDDVAAFVKPDPEDRNVRPDELAAFVESRGFEMMVRVNGSIDLLKRFISLGYPVMIEKGFDPEPERLGWMGHYLLLTGYSDESGTFSTMDSYLGPNRTETYEHIDAFWHHFNRTYLVAYPPDKSDEVAAIIGPDMDDYTMYVRALEQAQSETQQNPDDPFGWFNVGTNLVALGDHQNAAAAFDIARQKGTPWRMLWYQFGPYQAYLAVGGNRLYDVATLADTVIANNVYSEEAYYYKGLALLAQGETRGARAQFSKALDYNSNYEAAREALAQLDAG